jgi:peptidoglycan/LPS O-acetylase OafA/YrhL
MRAVLILAVLLPLALVVVWFVTTPIVARRRRSRRIAELERENERLDDLLYKE